MNIFMAIDNIKRIRNLNADMLSKDELEALDVAITQMISKVDLELEITNRACMYNNNCISGTDVSRLMSDKINSLNYAVYKYTDMRDNEVKYVGIVNSGKLSNRHKQHTRDKWFKTGDFLMEYIECDNQSMTEAIESHLISLYESDKWYNKAKAGWGINPLLPKEFDWKPYIPSTDDIFRDMTGCIDYWLDTDWIPIDRVKEWESQARYISRVNEYIKENENE